MSARKTPSRQSGVAPGRLENNQGKSSPGHGGARPNAGRKPGAATKRTREIADKAAEAGITPLDVMLMAMTALVEEAKAYEGKPGTGEERLKLMISASGVAKDAAPYIHPRLQAIEHTGADGKDLIPPAAVVGDPAAYYAWFVKQGAKA